MDKEEKAAAIKKKIEEANAKAYPALLEFLIVLGKESERSAVVLGAERLQVSLETNLKQFLRPSPNTRRRLALQRSIKLNKCLFNHERTR